MTGYFTRVVSIAMAGGLLPAFGAELSPGATNLPPASALAPAAPSGLKTNSAGSNKPDPSTAEKQGCIKNLKEIYKAIQAYEADHKDLPNWLSDLVPDYLQDANVLICPLCRRTGKAEAPPLADPKLPSSYLFEFCPLPLGNTAPNAPNRTRREWKRRQMGLVGSVVPIVRCRHHTPAINLAFDGKVYESPGSWELGLTNRINPEKLSAPSLFADERPVPSRFPPRDPKARPQLLDLTRFYNAALGEAWLGKPNETLSALPKGLQAFQETQFDVRGLVQLAGKSTAEKKFPAQVKALPVKLKCKQLHFLHAVAYGGEAEQGKQIGSYFVHYAGNPARLEIPIVYGRDVANWRAGADQKPLNGCKSAWNGGGARLFITSWTNLAPDAEIESVDFVSSQAEAAPFLVAISVE